MLIRLKFYETFTVFDVQAKTLEEAKNKIVNSLTEEERDFLRENPDNIIEIKPINEKNEVLLFSIGWSEDDEERTVFFYMSQEEYEESDDMWEIGKTYFGNSEEFMYEGTHDLIPIIL